MKVRLFTNDKSANLILTYSTLHGFAYWANLFNVPLYLQNVRGYGPIVSGAVVVPMLASHGVGSIISGQIVSRTGHYNNVILPGSMVWALGVSMQTLYTRTTPIYAVCLIGFLQGIGIGCAFQCSSFSSYPHSRSLQLCSKLGGSSSPLTQGRPSRHEFPPKFLAYYGWHTWLDRYDSSFGNSSLFMSCIGPYLSEGRHPRR